MKVTYLKLENVAGVEVGLNKSVLEISFEKSKNRIVSLIGRNGSAKTTILSSITPFANVTSLDERSTLSYITPHKNGYKEIHYQNGDDVYIIKHYFKANKDTHSVKSYFMLNGEELNPNGNVSSFNSLVEIHFGLTQEMMRLVRIGSNVNSFITLTPARRKEYIGKLIKEIETYLGIYKKINDDIRIVKTMMQANNTNLYNCHIDDIVVAQDQLDKYHREITENEKERDKIISKISKLKSLIADNDINDLRRKKLEAENSLQELKSLESTIESRCLQNTSVDDLISKRNKISDQKINCQSRINSFRLMIDTILNNIENLEITIKKITSNNDIQSLVNMIGVLKSDINATPPSVKSFIPIGSTSTEVQDVLSKLNSYNQISKMIYSLGNRPVNVYIKLRRDCITVDKWLKDQALRSSSKMNYADIQSMIDKIFADDTIITPNCDTEYIECPYYRIATTLDEVKTELSKEVYDDETLRYIEIISTNIDSMMNELDYIKDRVKLPDAVYDTMRESLILDRVDKKIPFFDLSFLQEHLSLLREYEIYKNNCDKLKQYEYQLSVYKQAGINNYMEDINKQKESKANYENQISQISQELKGIDAQLAGIDSDIGIVTKYNESKKYVKIFESTVSSTNKILEPLENANNEKMELNFRLQQINNLIASYRNSYRELDMKIVEYKRLVDEGAKLSKKNKDLSIILDSVSTKKGIPVFYMKKYLKKIQKLSNRLLELIYDDDFKLASFNVTPETFEVPYVKNGRKIPDIKYASQSEVALATMALSFALANNASGAYNILLLDEIDGGLDDANRGAFLKMLYMQMDALNAEQVFIISHNMAQMANIPMDCIKLTDVGVQTKLQNIIYE
jgi:DNA repair exonuclease SbcCD ATPase subunit